MCHAIPKAMCRFGSGIRVDRGNLADSTRGDRSYHVDMDGDIWRGFPGNLLLPSVLALLALNGFHEARCRSTRRFGQIRGNRPMMRFLMVVVATILGCQVAMAQQPGRHAADEAAIRRAVQSYVAAFNRGDAKGVARHWSPQGVYVSPEGRRFEGRAAIEKDFVDYFSQVTGQRIEVGKPRIRFIAPNVAVEEGTARVSRKGEPPVATSYMAVHVKHEDGWKLDSVRETVVPATTSHYEPLKQLEWLIGEWVDQEGDSSIRTVCRWTKNKNFMTRSFSVSIKDRIELEGTQVIGWDPESRTIRSWMFDSEGGFGQAVWTRKGNQWTIRASRTLNGGEKASSVNILTYVDRNRFRWRSTGREIAGELLPNIDEVTVVRKRPGA